MTPVCAYFHVWLVKYRLQSLSDHCDSGILLENF